ncbi:MAG: hypothetical protein ACXWKG_05570 [Limisphaerales bacterium]
MSDAIRQFIEEKVPKTGLVAWGAELADHTFASHCYGPWFTTTQVEHTVKRLSIAAQNLAQHQIVPLRLCWTFEHARMLLALRDDGQCLTFFVENRSNLSQEAFERALDEFLAQPMG